MDNILIAADGSPAAREAVKVGLELAAAEGASARVIHVSQDVTQRLFEQDPVAAPSREALIESDPVLREAAEHAETLGLTPELEAFGGHGTNEIVDAIIGIAQAIEADMIAVGARGRGAIGSALLGSVSRDVLRLARRPVMIVREPRDSA